MDVVSYILSKNAIKHVEVDVEEVKEEVAEIEEELDKKVNKDELGSSAYLDAPVMGDAADNEVVLGYDSRLSDARTPVAHTHLMNEISDLPTLGTVVTYDIPVMGDALPNEVVMGDDSRLTDSRDPNPHTHTVSDISDFPSLGTAAEKDWSNTYDPTSEDLITGKVVGDALGTLPNPMVFKGSLGEGGTISQLPAAVPANEGFTYKVITDGTYAGCVAHAGDSFTSDGSVWVHFPSGDEPGGTVMSVKIQGSGAIDVDDESAITTSGVRTISHNDSGVSAGTYTSVTVDGKGHVTAGSNPDISYNDLTDKPTLGTAAALDVPASGNASSSQVVKGDDSRLTDARTPVSHTHTLSEITDAGTAAALNVAATGDASTSEVVKGDDSRLTNARNAADVYAWAKEENKPSYTANEVGALPVSGTAADSDKLNGYASDVYATNDTIVRRSDYGYIYGTYLNSSAGVDTPTTNSNLIYSNADGFLRKSSLSDVKSILSLDNVDNTSDADKPISTATQSALDDKVDKVSGKGLSTNDYTTNEKNKLSGIAAGAQVNVQSDWNQSSSSADDYIKNKPANLVQDANYVHTDNNYTTTEKDKLNGIASGAEVNVQSDWNVSDSTSDAFIKNKPSITDTTYTVATGDSNGQIKVTPSSGNAYNVDVKGLAGGAYKAVDTTVTSGSSNLITSGAVFTAIDNLPEPMVFKGSLGTGGTITALPVNGSASIGDTYKVITAGTYAGQAAKVGDLFTCLTKTSSANTWEYFPSGDEPSGTVTSIKISATSPIAIDSDAAITTSGTRTISHANSGATAGSYGDSTAQTPGYEGTFKVPYVTVNATGHVTGISEHTVKIPASDNTNTTYSMTRDGENIKLTPSSGTAQNISLSSLINGLGEGSSLAEADDYLVAQYAGGGTTTTSYHRRKVSNVINAARVKAALGTGSGTSKYLREDGTWVTPPDHTYNFSGTSFTSNNSTGQDANNITYNAHTYYTSNGPATSLGASTNDGALYSQAYSTSWVGQIAQDYRNGGLYVRGKNNGTWQSWYKVWDSRNLTNLNQLTNGPGYITGITKAMVTTALGYTPPTSDTNNAVTQTFSGDSDNADYRVLFSVTADNTTRTEGARKAATLRFNPSKGSLMEGYQTYANGTNSHAENFRTTAYGNYSHAEGYYTSAAEQYSHTEGYYTYAVGSGSHAEGSGTTAVGESSHAEGYYTSTSDAASHAEGFKSTAKGKYSHAEGYKTSAYANYSHTEGYTTYAGNTYAHAEGLNTTAEGVGSHAEGGSSKTISTSGYSHAEGERTTAMGVDSHSEGKLTQAYGQISHAEGYKTTSYGNYSHTEGYKTSAYGQGSHAEGWNSSAYNTGSHAEGANTTSYGYAAHAEGWSTSANEGGAHAEGYKTTAYGKGAHAEGQNTSAYESTSHAEGYKTYAVNVGSHAEGYNTTATPYTHAEGSNTYASGSQGAHAEGSGSKALGSSSHAEGNSTTAYGTSSHAAGYYTSAAGDYQTVIGKYNNPNTTDAFQIGWGTSTSAKKNVFAVNQSGDTTIANAVTLKYNSTNQTLDFIFI